MSNSDDEEEFFDAEDENSKTNSVDVDRCDTELEGDDDFKKKAEGRLHPFKDIMLLKHPDTRLYVPICQDATPMTDDMLQEQSEIMSHLGTSAEATAKRVRMQLPSLVSDMEAFKAANLGCVLEDFVRWYSPRDYDETTRELSSRMKQPGNIWQEAWTNSRAVPVTRQKLLFDYNTEAEKVLDFLTNLPLNQLSALIIPVLTHSLSALIRRQTSLLDLSESESFKVDTGVCTPDNVTKYFPKIRDVEQKLHFVNSLKHKLNHLPEGSSWTDMKSSIEKLATTGRVRIEGKQHRDTWMNLVRQVRHELVKQDVEEAGSGVMNVIPDSQLLSPPSSKEYLFKVVIPRPAVYSKKLEQRLYCCIASAGDFKLASSISQDTSFA
jgi:Rab3 GTPase-activating protein catalytic subunit